MENKHGETNLFPFALTAEFTAKNEVFLAKYVMKESDRQTVAKQLTHLDAIEEFRLGCDAFNLNRLKLRLDEEFGDKYGNEVEETFERLVGYVVVSREYVADDFASAMIATKNRVRLPWGFDSLRVAFERTRRRPIRLLREEFRNSDLLAWIAGMALELTLAQRKEKPILLPVNNVRALLGQRKLVVSGAITRLISSGLLLDIGASYGLGKARQFRFTGSEGIDYEFVEKTTPAADDAETGDTQ